MKRKQKIKEWEIESGIRVNSTKGFLGQKNRIHTTKYSKEAFIQGIKKSEITVKTQKGLEFLEGNLARDEQWNSYIEHYIKNKQNRRKY